MKKKLGVKKLYTTEPNGSFYSGLPYPLPGHPSGFWKKVGPHPGVFDEKFVPTPGDFGEKNWQKS